VREFVRLGERYGGREGGGRIFFEGRQLEVICEHRAGAVREWQICYLLTVRHDICHSRATEYASLLGIECWLLLCDRYFGGSLWQASDSPQ
jgi:hypothetical protein